MKKIKFVLIGLAVILSNGCKKEAIENTTISTLEISNITASSANCGVIINASGNSVIKSCGICWSKNPLPTLDDTYTINEITFGSFQNELSHLNAGTTYYVRSYFTNEMDTVYGYQKEFETKDYIQFNPNLDYGTVTDIDGNVYKTIKIGTQTWMAENLRTTHYQNGDSVTINMEPISWLYFGKKEGAYCYYRYDDSKADIFGAYYDWFVASDIRNIAPIGWHVATEEDWKTLRNHCDPTNSTLNYGKLLREVTSAHWKNYNLYNQSNNNTGFTALASGWALTPGDNDWNFGNSAYFWTSSGSADLPVFVSLNNELLISSGQNPQGYSIRCVKD